MRILYSIFRLSFSNAQLKAIFNAYSNISKKTLDQAIKSETSGDLKDVLLAIGMFKFPWKSSITFFYLFAVRVMQSRPLFFAHQLKKALKVNISETKFEFSMSFMNIIDFSCLIRAQAQTKMN